MALVVSALALFLLRGHRTLPSPASCNRDQTASLKEALARSFPKCALVTKLLGF